MALINCPECGKEISDSANMCPNCGCPAEVMKEKIEQQKIEDKKPKMVQACSACGNINFTTYSQPYEDGFCLECRERGISHTVVELPYSCEEFENQLLEYDSSIRWSKGVNEICRYLFERYIKEWDSLKKETESYQIHYEDMYLGGKGPAHDAMSARVALRVATKKKYESQPVKVNVNVPKCPTCQSTDIKKISVTSKAGSVALWGLFSQKVKKQWHCNNCGSEW